MAHKTNILKESVVKGMNEWIKRGKCNKKTRWVWDNDECQYVPQEVVTMVDDVLDKIKAEIEEEYLKDSHSVGYWDGIDKCLDIIKKHLNNSEVIV